MLSAITRFTKNKTYFKANLEAVVYLLKYPHSILSGSDIECSQVNAVNILGPLWLSAILHSCWLTIRAVHAERSPMDE